MSAPAVAIPVEDLARLRGCIRDVLAVTLGDGRPPISRDLLVAVGALHAEDARVLGRRKIPLPPFTEGGPS